jgi:hypothetical protein
MFVFVLIGVTKKKEVGVFEKCETFYRQKGGVPIPRRTFVTHKSSFYFLSSSFGLSIAMNQKIMYSSNE